MNEFARDVTALNTRQLVLLAIRARSLAERVAADEIGFIDAVDMAYSAAVTVGLVDHVGDDVVQAVLGEAFMGVPRGGQIQ